MLLPSHREPATAERAVRALSTVNDHIRDSGSRGRSIARFWRCIATRLNCRWSAGEVPCHRYSKSSILLTERRATARSGGAKLPPNLPERSQETTCGHPSDDVGKADVRHSSSPNNACVEPAWKSVSAWAGLKVRIRTDHASIPPARAHLC